ncbi:MAG TPA: hypothetical protein PKA55_05620 [Rhodoblastus sp.]|nr:hypothetical protein [Rhodoblastus sp.]
MIARTALALGLGSLLLPQTCLAEVQTAAGIRTELVSSVCKTHTDCYARFSLTSLPTQILNASCNFYAPASQLSVAKVEIGHTNSANTGFVSGGFLTSILFPTVSSSTLTQYQFNSQLYYGVDQGLKPTIHFQFHNNTADVTIFCEISGPTPK